MHIKIKKGLNIPLANAAEGNIREFSSCQLIGLGLSQFSNLRLKLLIEVGHPVRIGEPLVQDKKCPKRVFLSPASGIVKEVIRKEKRSIQTIVIEKEQEEKFFLHETVEFATMSPEDIIYKLHTMGLLPHIISRPFCVLPDPKKLPKSIFIKALESAPYMPSPKLQLGKNKEYFQKGVDLLAQIAPQRVHLVHALNEDCLAFTQAKNVHIHTAEGPHPISNPSLHIYAIDPIKTLEDTVWTLEVVDVLTIGKMMMTGKYHVDRVVALAGEGMRKEDTGFLQGRMGMYFSDLIKNITLHPNVCLISGNPLTGESADKGSYLGFFHTTLSALVENTTRESFHFFRLGSKKYTATKTYLSGFTRKKKVAFTTNQHGEGRPFVDGNIYEQVMPMRIPTMHLMKALLSEDFDTAIEMGFLEIAPEDFALATFLCPSKNEMVQIVRDAIKKYSEETAR